MPDRLTMTDQDLLKRFSEESDHDAFATLVARHGPMVHAVCLRVLSNHHDAEDVTQAVFITLAREAGKLSGKASAAGWLHTVARRLSLNACKSRRSRMMRDEQHRKDRPVMTPDPQLAVTFRKELDAALASLPAHFRQPLILFHLEGCSLEEVSKRLDMNPATVRSRLSRAREKLRHILARHGVKFASVGGLTSLLSSELEASAFTPAIQTASIEAATGTAQSLSPRVMEIVQTGGLGHTGNLSALITNLGLFMKTQPVSISACVLLAAAIGTGIVLHQGSVERDNDGTRDPVVGRVDAAKSVADMKSGTRSRLDPLSRISSFEEYKALIESIFEIENEVDRLSAIQNRLGLECTEDQFYQAITAYHYRVGAMTQFEELLMLCLKDDPSAVLAWTDRFSGEVREKLMTPALSHWLLLDDASAMAWAKAANLGEELLAESRKKLEAWQKKAASEFPDMPMTADAATTIIRNMNHEFRTLAEQGGEQKPRYEAMAGRISKLISLWGERNPRMALGLFGSLDETTREEVGALIPLHQYVTEWAELDSAAALEWANGQRNSRNRYEALYKVLPKWQADHPDRNVEEVVDFSAISDHEYHQLINALVRSRSARDPSSAMEYAMGLEDPELRRKQVSDVMDFWVRKSPGQAQEWIRDLPPGKDRDTGLARASSGISPSDLVTASRMIGEIEDPGIRSEAVYGVMTIGKGIENHLTAALQLAGQHLRTFDYGDLHVWGMHVKEAEIPAYKAWVEELRKEDRIRFDGEGKPGGSEESKYRFIFQSLDRKK